MKIGIIGLGWFGWPLAKALSADYEVHGTTTSPEKLSREGAIRSYLLNLDPTLETENAEEIFDADCLVINIPPKRLGSGTSAYYQAQVKSLLAETDPSRTSHIIFISSTGVFGDHQEQVDEDTIPEPSGDSGVALLNAENFVSASFAGRVSIIRPGGMVGEDRHPARFLAGRSGVSGRLHPVNLVHRQDLIELTRFLIENKTDRRIFHAVAAQHPNKESYYGHAAEKMGLSPPSFDQNDKSKGKYVDGSKTQLETQVHFKFNDPYDMY